jgi:formylmethanofuran dehydrogenase subunit C
MTQASRGNTAPARQFPCTTAVSKRFGRYKDEKGKAVRNADITESEGLNQLISLCQGLKIKARKGQSQEQYDRGRFYHIYDRIGRSASQIEYLTEDVFAFSLMVERFDGNEGPKLELSAFLSAVINAGRETDYSLSLFHTDGDFPFLGYRNTKNIIIDGDIGSIGEEMIGGHIAVNGSVRHTGQFMRDGCIIINGDCGSLGSQMKGGKIVVKGSVRKGTGHGGSYCGIGFDTSGGSIEVAGDCENVANVSQGHITVGGDVKKAGMRNNGAIIRIAGSVTEELAKWMWDGEIHVEGEIPRFIGEFHGGKIFHKGRLVVDVPRSYGSGTALDIELPTGTIDTAK